MTARLAARNNPSLFAMSYDRDRTTVTDLIVVPRHFFTQDIIQARKPLSATARRAGWRGCNILIGQVYRRVHRTLLSARTMDSPTFSCRCSVIGGLYASISKACERALCGVLVDGTGRVRNACATQSG